MGILGLWPFIHHKGYIADSFKTIAAAAGDVQATHPRYLVDVQATFYATIRYAYTHKEITMAHNILRHAIEKTGLTTSAVLYLDGAHPQEKQQTHEDRAVKCREALKRAENAMATLQDRVRTGKRVRRHHFGNVIQNAKDGFRWSGEERRDCTPNDIVVSIDSDYFGYRSVNAILRPFRGEYRKYDVAQVTAHLGLSRDQLTALCIVSKNDYTSNITKLGPETNLKLISKLRADDASAIVDEYLGDKCVRRKNTSNESFAASVRVFVRLEQSAVSALAHQGNQQSFRDLLRELEAVKQEYNATKQLGVFRDGNAPRKLSSDEGPSNIFWTVDQPHERRSMPHPSGRPYTYRRRYSCKFRTPKIKHAPPDTLKMHQWKKPKDETNPEAESSSKTNKGRSKKRKTSKYEKKDPEAMDKKGLVYTMQHEHPTVSLTVGTVNCNLKAALERSSRDEQVRNAFDSLVAPETATAPTLTDLASSIKKCLKDVVRLASETKRICQKAVAVYVQRVSKNGVSEQDRRVLDKICGRVSEDEQDDEDENDSSNNADADDDSDKPEVAFMRALLNCIYNRRPPPDSKSSADIKFFIEQVKDVLPSMSDSGTINERMPYPATTVLRSTATAVATSMRQHFGRGTKTLAERVCDGFQLQLLAYKTKVLHSVKYRRLDENKLPPRISTTVGGTDYYMTEIRNVIRSAEDVTRLWNCKPEEVKVLGIDLGKAFVVGACALVPTGDPDKDEVKTLNLAVNQRAVYQPVFKHRRWSEHKKAQKTSAGVSIKEIEDDLPPLRGNEADAEAYVARTKDVESTLVKFYSDDDRESWKRHKFDLKKAFDEEFRVVADSLLQMVGGTSSAPRDENNNVLIAIGLGDFGSNNKLSSLHSSFSRYFVELARSLGYVVCGINEYYTSKRCPRCKNFVGQVTIRRLYCPSPTCQSYIHRDVLGGNNIAIIAKHRVTRLERPLYLQPIDAQGRYLWTNSGETSSSSGGEARAGNKRRRPE
ncbi:hypothetical protein BGZ70_001851 [Mortierella alpina]|uniref:Cas12f1-like TNB domain-containing protein n=1 Tax=Mortierella alpina TaxID=64518 RepID=A0A9P6JBD7_MORAP|nr:hypothetical protein BGZ70_001851 [Mortierella alpina]